MSSLTDINRPDNYCAPNVIERAACVDSEIMKEFEKTFVAGIDDPQMRTTETKWLQVLKAVYNKAVKRV